jgi:hypothetical protein
MGFARTTVGTARTLAFVCSLAACGSELSMGVDLKHANARAPFQTPPAAIQILDGDIADPYDVLADLRVTGRQRGALGEIPTREEVTRALQEHSGRLGAHVVIMFSCGDLGSSLWSYHELRCHGRAVRLR